MIAPDKYLYSTMDERAVIILPQTRVIQGKKVYIGLIAGDSAYKHWTEDGKLFGEKDSKADLA